MKGKIPALAKRSLAFALALALLLSLCPVLPITAKAASYTDGAWYLNQDTPKTNAWINIAFNTEASLVDGAFIYEGDEAYDWTITAAPTKSVPATVAVKATITDAEGNIVGGEPVFLSAVPIYKMSDAVPFTTMFSAAEYTALTVDMEGTFKLVCELQISGTTYASYTQLFTRVAGEASEETTEVPVETTETPVETTIPEETTDDTESESPKVTTYTDGAWYLNQDNPNKTNAWINIAFNTEAPLVDGAFIYEGDEAYDWTITAAPTKSVPATVAVKATITDAEGNIVGGEPVFLSAVPIYKMSDAVPFTTMFSAAEYTALTVDMEGTFKLVCELQISGTTYASYTQLFTRVADGENGEGGETPPVDPDEPETPDEPGSTVVSAHVKTSMNDVDSDNMTLSIYNWRDGQVGPHNPIGISTFSNFYYWDVGSGLSMNYTLSEEFLKDFNGNVVINVSYITAGPANVSLIYHSTSGTETIHPDSITVSAEQPYSIKTATFTLTDAVLTNTCDLGCSFMLKINRDRFRVTSVEVTKPVATETVNYTLDLNSSVADLVFLDETPFDLTLNATTDGAIEMVDVTYTLSGGNLAEALTETKKVALNKEGVAILDAAWFTEKAIGFGDFVLEVSMANEEKELANKTFNFSRKMTSILASELKSKNAENKDGVLVFGEDDEMDLKLFLKNKLSVPFTGNVTVSFYKNGALDRNQTTMVFELKDDAQDVGVIVPAYDEYGIYQLVVTVTDENGNEVHNKTFTFARQKTEFVNATLSSATNSDLVFVDDAPFDMGLNLQKTDGYDETLNVVWGIFKGEEMLATNKFSEPVTAATATPVALDWSSAVGYGNFTLKLEITNSLGYVQNVELPFSRIESVKVDLTSESNADLVFTDNEAYDLMLSLQKQSGEDKVFTVNYSVANGETVVKTGSIENVSISATANVLGLDMTGVDGNGNFTITVTLVEGEETVKTAQFAVVRKPSMTVSLAYPSAMNVGGKVTYIDFVPYDFSVSMQKPQGEAEAMTINYTVTDAEGNEVATGTTTASVGSAEAAVAALDLSNVIGYNSYNLAVVVLDANGNEVAKTALDFDRRDSITSEVTSETNPDLVFTEGEAFDLKLALWDALSGKDLSVTVTISGDTIETPLTKTVPIKSGSASTMVAALIPQLSSLNDVGTYTLNMTVTDKYQRPREDVSYTFSRVAVEGTINSDIQSASSPSLVFVPGGTIDMMLYLEKVDDVTEGFDAVLTLTDAEGNELQKVEAPIRPFLTTKFKVADLFDLAKITEPGTYNIGLTMTDNSGNERHTNSFSVTLVSLEGSVKLEVGSATNPDLVYTEGEDFDIGLKMTKTDGVAEAFKAFITITDKDGNVLKEREANVPARETMTVPIQDLIDLSDLPATGSFILNIVMVDVAGNERVNLDTPFTRVKLASVKTQISSNTNKDMIFTDKDAVDLMLFVQKIDDIPETMHIKYSVLDPNGNEIAAAEGKAEVQAGDKYFKQAIEIDPAMTAAHGTYQAILTITDNTGNVRSETTTKFIRIDGTGIKHQVSGSSSGTKMQFTPGMTLDLCLFVQKLDGVPESMPGELYVTAPSGAVILTMKGNLNVKAQGYSKYALDLNGKCNEFGIYTVTYIIRDDAGNVRASNTAKFQMISPTGEMAVAVQSTSGKFPGLIYGKDDAFDLVLYLQKADGVEQTLKLRYTISDMNGLVLETKEGNINVPALGYRKVPIELPDIEAFDKFGIFNMKVELAGPTGVLIYSENFSFSRVLTPEKQLDVLGVCTHLAKKGMTGAQSQQYVELARRAGASFWRDELPWSTVEPAKGQYKIPAVCDTAVDYTLSIGLEPLFILDYGNSNYGSDVTTDEWLEGYLGYVEYVVTHFKGRIKYYEVWNEWNIGLGGLDKKYRDYPELYARILIPTYKLIKEIDPSITVIGGVVAGGEEEWTEGLFKCPGVMDAMDAFSFHEYSDNDIKDIIKQTETVRELLDKYGKPDMPLWLTETSWPTHIGRNSFSEEESAGNLVSLYTWAMANPGVLDQIFWYDLHNDGVERENMEHNFGLLQNWDLDKTNVPMAAKPSYVALSAMNAILIDAECLGLYDLGQKGITAYHFKKDGKDMLVAWADDKALNMIANVGDNNIIVTDMYGNASALAPVDGKVSLFFSDAPIYIEYDLTNKLEMVEGGFELDKQEYSVTPAVTFPVKITRNNGLQTYSGSYVFSLPDGWSVEGAEFAPAADGATEIIDTVYITVSDDAPKGKSTLSVRVVSGTNIMGQFTVPVEMGDICTVNPDVVFTEDGHEFKLSVEIQNAMSNKPLKGTINLLAPSALLGDSSSITFEAPAGENKAFLLDMPEDVANNFYEVKLEIVLDSGVKHEVTKPVSFLYAIKAPEGMKLDGVIDDQWDGAMAFTAGEDDWLNHTGSDLEWPGNTFTGYAMWDDEYLYVAVEAYDVSHYQDGTGTSIWMGDSIQMGTDINRFYVPGELGYNDIGFSLSTDGSTIENWNWNAAPGKNVSKGGIFKVVRNDEACTTTYEVALPWSELMADGVEFKDYDQKNIGFSLLVNENSIDEEGDPTGRTGWIEYMSGIGVRKDPTKYGDLILVELPKK